MILSFWLQQWAIFSAAAVLFVVHEIYESTERISMIYNRGRVFGICSKTESLYRVPGLDYRTKFGANSFPRTFLVLNCRASVNISILRPHIYHCTLRHCCVREKKKPLTRPTDTIALHWTVKYANVLSKAGGKKSNTHAFSHILFQ